MSLFKKVRKNIRKARKARGWTQGELARRVGINKADICRMEVGSNNDMKLSRLEEFARALRVKVEELIAA